MTCKGGIVNFNIAANVNYEVSITSGGSPINWVHHTGTKALTPYSLDFTVDPNPGDSRTATITISSPETDDTARFTIVQYAYTPSFTVTNGGMTTKVPNISGNYLSGLVDFEGEIVEWSYYLTKIWSDSSPHSVEYFVDGATGFSLNSLANLINLDVTDF